MDEQLKQVLRPIADNETQIAALKQLFTKKFELPPADKDLDDSVLGQIYRAHLIGLQGVEEAFKELVRYKTPQEIKSIIKHR